MRLQSAVSTIVSDFTAGVFSPTMWGRVNYSSFFSSLRTGHNVTLVPQGGAMKTPGTFYVGLAKNNTGEVRFEEFVFSTDDSLVMEIGEEYIRFFKDHVPVMNGAVPYEVTTPYADEHIRELQIFQDSDLVFVVHPAYEPRVLSRLSDTNWTLTKITFDFPPMQDENVTSTTISASTTSGSTTLTASSSIFNANMVNGYFRIGPNPATDYLAYTYGATYMQGTIVIHLAKYYRWTTNVSSASYFSSEFAAGKLVEVSSGLVKITAVASGTSASGSWITIPSIAAGVATTEWAEGAFSVHRGYPTAVAIVQNRLAFGKDNTVYLSKPGTFYNFDMGTGEEDTDAIVKTYSFGQYNNILWITPTTGACLIGTSGGIINFYAAGSEILTAETSLFSMQDTNGASVINPLMVSNRMFYVHRDNQKVMEYFYDLNNDRFQAIDKTLRIDKLVSQKIKELVYQQTPYNQVFGVMEDGTMVALTRNVQENVEGWATHGSTFGDVITACCIPTAEYDEMWRVVEYVIDGNTVRYVEYQDDPRAYNLSEHVYTHSSLKYSGSPVSSVAGLEHLEGMTVQIRSDGAVEPDRVVVDGEVSLDTPGSEIFVGLGYTAEIETQNFELALRSGASLAEFKKIVGAMAYFIETFGATIGSPIRQEEVYSLDGSGNGDTAPVPFSGIKEVAFPGDLTKENATVVIKQEKPVAMLVNAVIAEVSA